MGTFIKWIFLLFITGIISSDDIPDVCQDDGEKWCPDKCTCSDIHVTCENLSHLPIRLPKRTFVIIIGFSHIGIVQNFAFKGCTSVFSLSLSDCGITALEKKAFAGLDNLKVLSLRSNSLNLSISSLPEGVFNNINQLRELHISDNVWQGYKSYRDDLVEPLVNLFKLDIDGLNDCVPFGKGFQTLRQLQLMTIRGGLNKICNNTLTSFSKSKLTNVIISNSQLTDLEPLAFANLSNLYWLEFFDNPNLNLFNLSSSWYGLQFTIITNLEISKCWSYKHYPLVLTESFFRNLEFTKIKSLTMKDNNIWYFPSVFSRHLQHLTHLTLREMNVFSYLHLIEDIPNLNNLDTLEIHAFGNYFPSIFIASNEENYDQNSLFKSTFHTEPQIFEVPLSLETLTISFPISFVLSEIPPITIRGSNKLKYVNIQHASLQNTLKNPFVILKDETKNPLLVEINLGSNNIESIAPGVLSQMLTKGLLQSLILSQNNFRNGMSSFLHKQYCSLKNIDLSSNSLTFLPVDAFKYMQNIETLNLYGNSLRQVNFSTETLHHLSYLDLSHNLISYLDAKAINQFEKIQQNLTLSLQGNPLVCDCDSVLFLQWILETHMKIDYLEITYCSFMGQTISLSKLTHTDLKNLQMKCTGNAFILWSAVSLCCTILALGILICIYRHRWDVKFFCLNLTRKRKLVQATGGKVYTFDAFVAFHQNDVHWVKTELIPNLEEPKQPFNQTGPPFTLCVHQRNWIAGISIEENIVESIQKSRKTILVLSKKFATSGWCDFETQMAKLRSFEEGQDIIIVIMLEQIPASELTGTLRTLVRKLNYLEWPLEKTEQVHFWKKLRNALRKDGAWLPQCECGRTFQT